ncbi:sugar phosphate isomerase/epimerase family protein [Quadrisphaera setariae]|uniref:Sugar phosphate isomerase/epimerase n=1 Tax=Quadrisphaera setariae TaxID=2593304 RepID=A0A5C8Z7K2_9ACTN|nr:TIM barrel protein [Quadrisphaera setariae]TXR52836.1 sugar phosphate isomerase/epimerase [Quadrisphaera setariae]
MTAPVSVDVSCLLGDAGGDPAAAVHRAVASGFTAVEPWAFDQHVDAYRTALRASGASAPSGRASTLDAERPDDVFDAALELGIGVVVDGCTDAGRWSSAERAAQLAARVNDLAAAAHARGLRLAYRTGSVELRSTVHGTHALHVFVRQLDPRVGLDVDVFAASAAGTNAALLLQVLGERVRILHLTDGSFDSPAPRQRPLGWGGLNLPRILRAAPQAARVLTFTDPAADVTASLRRSLRWLQAHEDQQTHQP